MSMSVTSWQDKSCRVLLPLSVPTLRIPSVSCLFGCLDSPVCGKMVSISTVMAVRLHSPLLLLCLLFKAHAKDVCKPEISLSKPVDTVCLGDYFNLSCQFVCLSLSRQRQLWHGKQLLLNMSVDTPNSTLHYYKYNASNEHNGTYECKTELAHAIAIIQIHINGTCEEKNNSEASTVESVSFRLVVWYLLCKAGAFFLFITATFLPICRIH